MRLTDRCINGITAVLLALKKRPTIRYSNGSALARQLAHAVEGRIDEEAHLFHFKQVGDVAPLLLVLDRRDDPVTPLLNQWTYQVREYAEPTSAGDIVCLSRIHPFMHI